MLNDLLERKITEAAEWFCDNPNCGDIKDALRELVAEAMSIENEACAKVCEELRDDWGRAKIGAKDGRYDMMEEAASICEDEIRERSNDEIKRARDALE